MREVCPRKQGVSRGLRPNLLILNKAAITSLSLFKPFSSNRGMVFVRARMNIFDLWALWDLLGLLERRDRTNAHA